MSFTLSAREIRLTECLNSDTVAALLHGDLDIIHVAQFWQTYNSQDVLGRIRAACAVSAYTLTEDLQSLGTSIGEYDKDPGLRDHYFASAKQLTERVRNEFFWGHANPLDNLRAQLDEFWYQGSTVARDEGGHMLPAVVRRWVKGGLAHPHIDACRIPALSHLKITRRIGTNIYLAVPPSGNGGEIEFWGRVTDERTYQAVMREDYGLERKLVGEPKLKLAPGVGDLIMFDASQVHAVTKLTAPDRITLACFIGYSGEGAPLRIFA